MRSSSHAEISEYSICRSSDGMHGGRPVDRLGSDLRKPDVADIASLDHFRDGADRVLDRHVRIEPRRTVDVDMIRAEALQSVGERILHGRRPRVEADQLPAGSRRAPNLTLMATLSRTRPFRASAISISLWPMP